MRLVRSLSSFPSPSKLSLRLLIPSIPLGLLLQVMIASTVISHVLPSSLPPTLETRRQLSPHHLLSPSSPQNYPPIFLAIPQLDTLVPPSQSWRFAERLKEVGVEVETARAEGAGHAFDLHGGPRTEEGGDWWEGVIRKGLDFLVGKLR